MFRCPFGGETGDEVCDGEREEHVLRNHILSKHKRHINHVHWRWSVREPLII